MMDGRQWETPKIVLVGVQETTERQIIYLRNNQTRIAQSELIMYYVHLTEKEPQLMDS